MHFTHRFEFKPKVSLPTVCSSCQEEIQPKESVARVNGAVYCYHCTNIASYQDYAYYRAKEKVAIKQFFDILVALIFGGFFIVLAYLLLQNDPVVSFVPRFLAPVDVYVYAIVGALIIESPYWGFIIRAARYRQANFFEAIMRFPKILIYPDYPEPSRYQLEKKGQFVRFILAGFLTLFLTITSPIVMIIRLVQYLNYGAKINRIDDQYLREQKNGKQLKEFNLYVKHVDEEQKKLIEKLKAKYGKYPKAVDEISDPEYMEVYRGLRLYRAFRLRYKLEAELAKKYPDGKFVFVISKN